MHNVSGYPFHLPLSECIGESRIGTVEFPAAVMLGGCWMDDIKLEQLREAARDTSLIRSVWRALQMKL